MTYVTRTCGRLADACGGIPLALRIAAAHLVTRNEVTVSDLLEDLSRYRLDVLTVPHDGHACVRTAIDVSLRRRCPSRSPGCCCR